jgi:uroporphyrinogen-III synthase
MSTLAPVLAGCRVLVTAQRRSAELSSALARRGAEVVVVPALGVESHIDEHTLLARTRDILRSPVDTFVATTGVGFRGWLETAETAGLAGQLLAVLGDVRLLARGAKALGAMQAAGLKAEWVAESETAAEIADLLLTEGVVGRRIAVQHHAAGDDGLDRRLTAAGADVVPLVVYRWGPPPDPRAVRDAVRQVADGRFDAVVFTSAPGASAWLGEVARLDATDAVRWHVEQGRLLVAAVGPVTAEPLDMAGMQPLIPDRSRMGALIRRIVMDLGDADRGVRTPAGLLHLRASAATLDHTVLPVSASGLTVLRRIAETPSQMLSREHVLAFADEDRT